MLPPSIGLLMNNQVNTKFTGKRIITLRMLAISNVSCILIEF